MNIAFMSLEVTWAESSGLRELAPRSPAANHDIERTLVRTLSDPSLTFSSAAMDVPSSSQRVISTYSAAPAFLTAPDWANIRTAVRSHLPLKNLHWKPVSRPSLRTIQTVDVEFRALEVGTGSDGSSTPASGGAARESMTPGSFLEKPFLNIYFVTCPVSTRRVQLLIHQRAFGQAAVPLRKAVEI